VADVREFRRFCYESARRTGGRVVEFRIAEWCHTELPPGIIDYGDHRLSVVCTRDRTEPVVAVAEPREIDGNAVTAGSLTFIDAPELVAVLAEHPAFQVLTPADLARPFDAKTWPGYYPGRPQVLGSNQSGRDPLQLLGLT